jgi:hypothetical protein
MENNNRKNERTAVALETVLEWSSGKRETRISDLSLGGCFVDSTFSPHVNDVVILKVQVLPGEWLKLSGEVVYVYPGIGFGVRFTLISDEERLLLEKIIPGQSNPG